MSHCTVYIQLSSAQVNITQCHTAFVVDFEPLVAQQHLTTAREKALDRYIFIQVWSCVVSIGAAQKDRGPQRDHCVSNWEVGILTPAQRSRTAAVSFAECTNKPLETPGQMAQLWRMKNNLVPNVVFFNTPFIVGCSADPLGNNVAFCVSSASPPFSLPCAEK